ncbi:hypothetical protein [Embleya sp. NPDC050493]|uniref:hypothetical protein n=1 Tax=Embleya sp. NPDC050493 TaxID=3363989 RepID=UPI003795A4D5
MTAPPTVDLPKAGDDLTWRPVTAADIDLILDLKRAAGTIDHPRYLEMRDELEEEFASETFDLERDAVIVQQLANLATLPPAGFKVAFFPLKLARASAAPARVVAFV